MFESNTMGSVTSTVLRKHLTVNNFILSLTSLLCYGRRHCLNLSFFSFLALLVFVYLSSFFM